MLRRTTAVLSPGSEPSLQDPPPAPDVAAPEPGFAAKNRGDRTRTCNPRFWRPVLYQLSYTPRSCVVSVSASPRASFEAVGRLSLPLLFSFLTLIFAVIGVAAALHNRWVITVAAAAIGLWMASFAWQALRRMRR